MGRKRSYRLLWRSREVEKEQVGEETKKVELQEVREKVNQVRAGGKKRRQEK